MVEDCWEWLTPFISYHSLKTALWCIHLSISKLDDYSMHDSGRTTPVSVTIYYGSQNVSHCPSSWEKFKGWAMMTYRCRSLLADIKGTSPPWDIVLKVHVYIQCGQKCFVTFLLNSTAVLSNMRSTLPSYRWIGLIFAGNFPVDLLIW